MKDFWKSKSILFEFLLGLFLTMLSYGREADIFINPSYDWKAFQYFTSYGVQARAIECGFSVLRNPVNGNIILYDVYGRPLHMANVMNVHTGMIYLDIPKKGRQTIYGATGNWFPWLCAVYSLFAIISAFVLKKNTRKIAGGIAL